MKLAASTTLAVLISAAFAVIPAAAPDASASTGCKPVAVIAFRGSGEKNLVETVTSNAGKDHRYGKTNLVTNGWEGWRLKGMLEEYAPITYKDGFKADSVPVIAIAPPDSTTDVGYPAVEAWTEVFSKLNGSAVAGTNAAVKKMTAFKASQPAGCPSPQFIAVGYSQGAMAARLLAQANPKSVIGVIDIGDPYQKPDSAGNEGSKKAGNGFMRWNYPFLQSTIDKFYGESFAKAAICHDGDVICDFRWGTSYKFATGDFKDHGSYYTSAYPNEAKDKAKQVADLAHTSWKRTTTTTPPTTRPADVVFVIDTTGSMSGYIDQAVATAASVAASTLAAAPGSRVGLVQFRDHGDDIVAQTVVPLTTNFSSLTAGLSTLYADGGGDWPEAVYSGIVEGARQSWKAGVSRSIILIGDAPPHDPEDVTGYTAAQVTAILKGGPIPAAKMLARSAPVEDDSLGQGTQDGPDAVPPTADVPVDAGDAPAEPHVDDTGDPTPATTRLAPTSPVAAAEEAGSFDPIVLYAASAVPELTEALTPITDATGGQVFPIDDPDGLDGALEEALEDTTEAPSAAVRVGEPAIAGLQTVISAVDSATFDNAGTFEFDLDGDGTFELTPSEPSFAHAFPTAGTYTVGVKVTDTKGRASVAQTTVDVLPESATEPLLDFTTPTLTVKASPGTVVQGAFAPVTVEGGEPSEYLLVPEGDDVWTTAPTYTAPVPENWATAGLEIPATVPTGSYSLVIGSETSGWGQGTLQVTAAPAGPTTPPTTPPSAGPAGADGPTPIAGPSGSSGTTQLSSTGADPSAALLTASLLAVAGLLLAGFARRRKVGGDR
ncbi:cutinase family protein [Leifsonia sp. Leaf264]|uniref:cutinase family protein n=1 Tax=Leifsonia sp. Leaf264 TaxID=1736314 RepID=UPI0006F7668D|nr:cutinase family protein [Leifsonia sp. Leaf264]KQO98500.1 hypothetical protein ASF30_10585 [Leifsonia sp. Leaf264]